MNFTSLRPGHTVEGAEIEAFRSEKKSSSYIYLMAGVHGDEVEGVYVLQNLFEWMKQSDDLDFPCVVIPIVNIDGYRQSSRTNAHGVDLNRNLETDDWSSEFSESKYNPGSAPFSEPENQYLAKLFSKFRPGHIITFHSWRPILNYNGDCKDVADFLHQYNKYDVKDSIGYPTPGSLGTYAPGNFDCPVLTYECPTLASSDKTLKEIWEENEEGLKALLGSGLLKRFTDS